MPSLPNSMHDMVVLVAELRVENRAAWRAAIHAAGGPLVDESQLRLSLDEVLAFLAAAWRTVAEVLPTVVAEDPAAMLPPP